LTDEKIAANEMINWMITLKDDPKMIGTIGYYHIKPEHYRAEIGYMLLPNFQGRGYVTEAIAEVVKYGFKRMKLHSIEAVVDPIIHYFSLINRLHIANHKSCKKSKSIS